MRKPFIIVVRSGLVESARQVKEGERFAEFRKTVISLKLVDDFTVGTIVLKHAENRSYFQSPDRNISVNIVWITVE